MEATMQGTGPRVADVVVRRSIIPSVNQPAPRDALLVLDQFGTIVSVQHDRQIHGQGDQADFCYRILSGCVRTVKLMEDGRRQIGEFLMAGDLLGFDALEVVKQSDAEAFAATLARYTVFYQDAGDDRVSAMRRRLARIANPAPREMAR